jgi:S1-C subfamily serine protease
VRDGQAIVSALPLEEGDFMTSIAKLDGADSLTRRRPQLPALGTRSKGMLLATLISLASCWPARSQEVSTKTIARVKPSVFPVVCAALNPANAFRVIQMVGTGFLINRQGGFMTAGHVAEELSKFAAANNCFGAVFIAFGSDASEDRVNTRWFRISSCASDQQLDLAACSVTQNPFEDASLASRIAVLKLDELFHYEDGTAVAFTGYPLEMGRPLTSKGFIAARYPNQLLVDKAAWPGASGSPVYTAAGTVIGLLTKAGMGIGAGIAYAVPSDTMVDFLQKAKIKFEQ